MRYFLSFFRKTNELLIIFFTEQDSKNQSKAEEESRIYYRSCLDKNETIEKLGAVPMQEFLKEVSINFNFHKIAIAIAII